MTDYLSIKGDYLNLLRMEQPLGGVPLPILESAVLSPLLRTYLSTAPVAHLLSPPAITLLQPSLPLLQNDQGTSAEDLSLFWSAFEFQNRVEASLFEGPGPSKCNEMDTTGGVWFIPDSSGDPVAVFKPTNAEAGIENEPARKGILPGEGATHEFAVNYLSRNCRAPLTCLVSIKHPSFGEEPCVGSLQQYIPHDCPSWDLGPSCFSENDVHLVGVLDIRFLNTDRHGGNLLVSDRSLIPIDHTYCLPDSRSLNETWFEWIHWPQAKKPFSSFLKLEILKFDISSSVRKLKVLQIREECIFNFVLSNVILKEGVLRGMNLFQIGSLCSRTDIAVPSAIEKLSTDSSSLSLDRPLPFLLSELSKAVSDLLDLLEV